MIWELKGLINKTLVQIGCNSIIIGYFQQTTFTPAPYKTSKITGNLQNMKRGEKENFKRANKLSFFTGAACRALAKHRVYTPR